MPESVMPQPPPPPYHIECGSVVFGNDLPFVLIAGPCALESREHALDMSGRLTELCRQFGVGLVYKTSFDKANRTALAGARGVGLEAALPIFDAIRTQNSIPVLTDIHQPEQARLVAPHVDILQIPAFLCRQTDLLVAAGQTGGVVNVKKGQFLAPWDVGQIVDKLEKSGCHKILLTERGSSFGYNTLVADMRALPIMAQLGYPVVMDATHAVQQPGGKGKASGGDRRFAPVLARAALAVGVAAVFAEMHEAPERAPSDGPNMIRLEDAPALLEVLCELDRIAKKKPIAF